MKNNIFILPMFFMSIVYSLSSSSWMTIWVGMEMNLLMFIFIILMKKTMMSNESSMKYFLIQTSGSLIFLFSLTVNMIYYEEWSNINAITPPIALMLKSGMAPLHSWSPEIVCKFDSTSLFLFLTLQKIVPILIMFSSWINLMMFIAMTNIIIGSIGGISQSSIRKMMIFSSINNIGWMMMSISISMNMFWLFFSIYFIINLLMIMLIKNFKINWILQIKSNKMQEKLSFFCILMSLSGLPPFLGFASKWLVISKNMQNMPMINFIAIFFSIFTLFFYIKYTINMIFMSVSNKKWIINFYMANKYFTLNLINIMGIPVFLTLS
uniref:NADH-ubiquinone oxidoreductase chain 2 n=1 Tax=Euphyllura phillyreae TaxID=2008460 RepID=A0A344A2A5_9HEMI|nr:NADH dehydrogenase subunit 2 [Euphyllura phillyreae]AWU48896.1 NADH dehydrogenase subunit 2 [Euphyllura phillyreae]